jgi:GTPase Era involved in 16S rRNA processing
MNDINQYLILKEKIIKAYETLKTSGLLPVKLFDALIDEEAICGAAQNLADDKFVVSVCGQIKAGKSMLLNEIIFGGEVLPAADTPETAKITEISYAEEPGYTVYFYSPEEWEFLKKSTVNINGAEAPYYETFIKPALDEVKLATGKELDEAEALGQKTVCGSDLRRLGDFISVKGAFTPIVKAVRIKYPAALLKNISIVDTPGINDPNAIRSRITEKWINRSDAIIFLLSAAQPFTAEDRDFFGRYLTSIPASKILTAVSKIDLAEDIAQVKKFVGESLIKTLGKTGEEIVAVGGLSAVAPMFALFKKLKAAAAGGKIELSPERRAEIDYQLTQRAKSSELLREIIDKDGYIPDFLSALEAKLINSKNAILESHVKKIEAVYNYHIKNNETEKANLEAEIKSLEADSAGRGTVLAQIAGQKTAVEEFKSALNAELNKMSGFFNQRVEEISSSAADKIIKTLIAKHAIEELNANLGFDSYSIIENNFIELNAKFNECIGLFKSKAFSLAAEFSPENYSPDPAAAAETSILYKNTINQVFNKIDAAKVLLDIKNIINSSAGPEALKGLKADWFFFWTDAKKTKENFTGRINQIFITDLSLQRVMLNAFSDSVTSIKTALGQFLFRMDNNIAALKKKEAENAEALERARISMKQSAAAAFEIEQKNTSTAARRDDLLKDIGL